MPVYVPTLLLAFAEGLLLPTLPSYARSFDVSFGMAALVLAAAGIGTMLADVPAGMILGRLGLKPTMLIGAGLNTAALFALGLASVFPELVAYRLIAGVGAAMWGLSRHAFITETIDPRQRGRAISVFGGINRIGTFSGPLVGGLVGEWFGLTTTFYLAGTLALIGTIFSAIFIEDTRVVTHAQHSVRWSLVWSMVRQNRGDLAAASVAQIGAQLIRSGRQAIIPFYGEAVLGLNVAQIGTIQSGSSMVDMTLFFPAGYIMDRFGRKFTSVPSFALMGIGMALIPLSTGFISLLVVSLLIGVGNGLGSGAMMTLGADLAPRGATGEFLGLWRSVGDSGRAAGPLAVGGLVDSTGFGPTSVILAGVGVASALVLGFLVRETRVGDIIAESPPVQAK